MKALLALALLVSGPAFAESENSFLDGLSNPAYATRTTCKEGAVQVIPNDGACRFSDDATNTYRCVNGKYVLISTTCN